MPDFSIETNLEHPVIGLDEVGRGPLAGPVVSCGCYFKNYEIQNEFNDYIGDSKKLSKKKREVSFKFLQNLKKITFRSDILKKDIKLNVANSALRTVDFKGGLDKFLLSAKNSKLSIKVKKIKASISAKL